MIFEWAGILHLDPGPFTARELRTMYLAYQRESWDRIAMLQVIHCTESVHPFDLNPYRKRRSEYGAIAIEHEYERLKRRGKVA